MQLICITARSIWMRYNWWLNNTINWFNGWFITWWRYWCIFIWCIIFNRCWSKFLFFGWSWNRRNTLNKEKRKKNKYFKITLTKNSYSQLTCDESYAPSGIDKKCLYQFANTNKHYLVYTYSHGGRLLFRPLLHTV